MNGDGAVLVVAGPGSGKTRTLVYRVCRLLEMGKSPESILLLTFTNKAAREMKSRAESLMGPDAGKITGGTFHHFCNLILRKHATRIGLQHNYTILDDQDAKAVLKHAVMEEFESVKKGAVESVMRVISLSKLKMQTIEEVLAHPDYFHMRKSSDQIERIARVYRLQKREMNVVDFDDLLVLANEILNDETARDSYKGRYRNILVDEFQDTDRLQAAIIEKLYSEGANLMAVGDDSQSIYSFRGADISNILEFQKKFDARIFYLVSNYRSTRPIVDLVNGCISGSSLKLEKKLVSLRNLGGLPSLLCAQDRADEAQRIGSLIQEDIESGKTVGVLFRAAYMASELEIFLSGKGIPYELRGGIRFFEQKHIKDMVSILKVHENPKDRASAMRLLMLFPGIGDKGARRILSGAKSVEEILSGLSKSGKSGRFSEILSDAFSGSNAAAILDRFYVSYYREYLKQNFEDHETRSPDIDTLLGAAARYEDVSGFLESFTLDGGDRERGSGSKLILSTIHQAKGLEWDSVYIICLADGMLPIARSFDVEEERRLFYVAASRARNRLVMSYPRASGRFYEYSEQSPSRFLLELPEGCFDEGDSC